MAGFLLKKISILLIPVYSYLLWLVGLEAILFVLIYSYLSPILERCGFLLGFEKGL